MLYVRSDILLANQCEPRFGQLAITGQCVFEVDSRNTGIVQYHSLPRNETVKPRQAEVSIHFFLAAQFQSAISWPYMLARLVYFQFQYVVGTDTSIPARCMHVMYSRFVISAPAARRAVPVTYNDDLVHNTHVEYATRSHARR